MRRLPFLAAAAVCAACATPRPCTMALCPTRFEGSYRVRGWTASVVVSSGTAAIPIVSDSTVEVEGGRAEFVNGRSIVTADAGASFRFSVSADARHVPSIIVDSGSVSVAQSSTSAATPLVVGRRFDLPTTHK